MRPLRAVIVAAALSLAFASPAAADIVLAQDAEGRTITFDVQASGVDTAWYASVLSDAIHGDEISSVTIRIVPQSQLAGACGAAALACYTPRRTGAVIVVPAGQTDTQAAILLHEYGHHIDARSRVVGVREPNGTPRWWAARGMAALVAAKEVARGYALGWERGIGEIFAEDYVQTNMAARFRIRWLAPPSEEVMSAIRQDLGAEPALPIPPAAEPQRVPLNLLRSGLLRAGRTTSVPFTLLGPNRRVTFTVTATGARRAGPRVRVRVVCGGRVVATRTLWRGQTTAKLDRAGLGPASCRANVTNVGKQAVRFSLRLRLAVEA